MIARYSICWVFRVLGEICGSSIEATERFGRSLQALAESLFDEVLYVCGVRDAKDRESPLL